MDNQILDGEESINAYSSPIDNSKTETITEWISRDIDVVDQIRDQYSNKLGTSRKAPLHGEVLDAMTLEVCREYGLDFTHSKDVRQILDSIYAFNDSEPEEEE